MKKLLIFIKNVYESDDYLIDEGLNKHIKEVIGDIVNKEANKITKKAQEESYLVGKMAENISKDKDKKIKQLEEEIEILKSKKTEPEEVPIKNE